MGIVLRKRRLPSGRVQLMLVTQFDKERHHEALNLFLTDTKKKNQEIMALYKEHNVNPLGGCLPLVLQFPLLFAFYSLLANSIELRQWVKR